jgi:hypothetical protein
MSSDEYITFPKVTTIAGQQTVSRELLGTFPPIDFVEVFRQSMTPEGRAAAKKREAQRQVEVRALRVLWHDTRATAIGLRAGILDIHKPDEYGYCPECSGDEWSEDWPCATAALVLAGQR